MIQFCVCSHNTNSMGETNKTRNACMLSIPARSFRTRADAQSHLIFFRGKHAHRCIFVCDLLISFFMENRNLRIWETLFSNKSRKHFLGNMSSETSSRKHFLGKHFSWEHFLGKAFYRKTFALKTFSRKGTLFRAPGTLRFRWPAASYLGGRPLAT